MSLGQFLSSAGLISTGARQREDELRRARLAQLTVEEENRRASGLKNAAAGLQVGGPPDMPFGAPPDPMEIGPGAPRARQVVAPPESGVTVGKPAALPMASAGYAKASESFGSNKLDDGRVISQITREQFLGMPAKEQQRLYQEHLATLPRPGLNYLPNRFVGDSLTPGSPGGIGTVRAIGPGSVPRHLKAKQPTFEEFASGFKSTAAAGARKRGTVSKGTKGGTFNDIIPDILASEGGYVNDPDDTGGETNYGISKAANPDIDVANLTPESAAAIYKERYWDAINADALPPAIRHIAFDAAVNQGVGFAKQAAKASGGDPEKLLQIREQRYRETVRQQPAKAKFFDGWMSRLERLAAGVGNAVIPAASADTVPEGVGAVGDVGAGGGSGTVTVPAKAGVQTEAPAQRRMSAAEFYQANPQEIPVAVTSALKQREQLAKYANMYLAMRSDDGMAKYQQLKAQIDQIDESLPMLAGMQAIQELSTANDPTRLSQVWSHYARMPISIQPQADGTYSVFINGKPNAAKQFMTTSELAEEARSAFDPEYVARKATAQTEANLLQFKSMLKRGEDVNLQSAAMIRELNVAQAKGNVDAALEILKSQLGWKVQFDGSGNTIITPPGEGPYMLKADGEEMEIDGVKVRSFSAKRIPLAGLR